MQVHSYVVTLNGDGTAGLQLLAGLCGLFVDDLGNLLAVNLQVVEFLTGVDLGLTSSLSDLGSEGLESLVLGHEVGLAVDLHHRVAGDSNQALSCLTLSALGHVLCALDAQVLDGLVIVTLGLVESLLAIEHAGAGGLTQCLYVCSSVVRHSWSDPPWI